jgi:acid phosphatase (class A)
MKHFSLRERRIPMLGCALVLVIAACATVPQEGDSTARMGGESDIPAGYLTKEAMPDSLALVPAPPAAGSAAFAHDEEVQKDAATLRDTPRYGLAAMDAVLTFPRAPEAFVCALGAPIDAQHTPRLYKLLQRTLLDAGISTSSAKNQYKRTRPFAVHEESTCTPQDEPRLRNNGSYPSGHAAIGWAWALILAEAEPARADAILARGRSFGESRLVCNVHWQSDILEGRLLAAAVVSQLHTVDEFRRDIEAARQEIAGARAKGLPPGRDCAMEAAALKLKIPGAP